MQFIKKHHKYRQQIGEDFLRLCEKKKYSDSEWAVEYVIETFCLLNDAYVHWGNGLSDNLILASAKI